MSLATVQQRESELMADFAEAPAGIAGGARLALTKKPRAYNAMTHGLSGHHFVISADELLYYAQMGLEFMLDIRPVGVREIGNAQMLFEGRWRLQRILSVENDLFCIARKDPDRPEPADTGKTRTRRPGLERQVDAFREEARHIELISRYETRIIRNSARVDVEVERLQQRRGAKQRFDEESSPATVWYRKLLKAANALAQAKQDYEQSLATEPPENTEENTHKNPDLKPITQTVSAHSSPISISKKESPMPPEVSPKRNPSIKKAAPRQRTSAA